MELSYVNDMINQMVKDAIKNTLNRDYMIGQTSALRSIQSGMLQMIAIEALAHWCNLAAYDKPNIDVRVTGTALEARVAELEAVLQRVLEAVPSAAPSIASSQWWLDQNGIVFEEQPGAGDLYNMGCDGPFASKKEADKAALNWIAPRAPATGHESAPPSSGAEAVATFKVASLDALSVEAGECPTCSGTGRLMHMNNRVYKCKTCKGTGKQPDPAARVKLSKAQREALEVLSKVDKAYTASHSSVNPSAHGMIGSCVNKRAAIALVNRGLARFVYKDIHVSITDLGRAALR